MKTRYIAIFALIGVFILCIQNVFAIPYMSPQDLYKQSDMIFHGQVISKQAGPGPDYYYYQIKVDTFFKNPQTSDSITTAGHKPVDGRMAYPQFEIGDKAIFYTSKVDGVNTIGLFSQKAGMACDAQSFLVSAYLPNNIQSFSSVASNARITDINGNAVVGKVQRGQPIQITYDEIWNNYPEYRAILLHMSIQNMVDTKPAFEENRTIFLNACDGPSPVKLNFVPEKNGTYIFSLNIDKKLTTSTSFDVGDSSYSVTMMAQSPLKQFKSGISAMDVKCSVGYVLTIKSEDGSPACVRPLTVKILSEVGWSKFESTQSNHATNAKTNPFGIVGLMYYHGGGPCGVGDCPLNTFNLKMNSNYTAYLLGYNICNDNSCITRNNLSILLPLNVIGIPDYKFIALPENTQWKYADVFHIQVEVSSIPDNTTAVWTDLGNSTITH